MDLDVAAAAQWDRDGAFPREVVKDMAAAGWLCSDVDREGGATALELGELCARLGAVCTALRGLVTVQGMVAAVLSRWGT
ncbi:acyl-CoA dehydrogenase family protein, partial [Saccharothrix sp. MB29]|nr:acyl-CoA dehydrogenase family protein [Saccharothrix sp. MB29]